MLTGRRYCDGLPDDNADGGGKLLFSEELLVKLRAIEKEISQFIRGGAEADETDPIVAGGDRGDQADN